MQPQEEELYCYWNDCLLPFPGHDALSHHLSEDHIGWKKGEYCCEWTNCSRKGVKCHNRFALMMHLRIHTGEKPFECDVTGCGMNFGRLDALTRHKKAEHGMDMDTMKKIVPAVPTTPFPRDRKPKAISEETSSQKMTIGGFGQKRKMAREEDHQDKHKRGKVDNGGKRHTSESEDVDPYDLHTRLSPQNKYKIAKAKLKYILRENEMLTDEWTTIQRRLGRLQTERRVLLDALMTAEGDQDGDLFSSDDDYDVDLGNNQVDDDLDEDDTNCIPIKQHDSTMTMVNTSLHYDD
ncbi:hypothetical protein BC941DRAFT_467972 [Chlamydoabsidia padenii]|nr:hypothetical protein BC941DRAFT_467972 [Chlamydoabsidia padenii]